MDQTYDDRGQQNQRDRDAAAASGNAGDPRDVTERDQRREPYPYATGANVGKSDVDDPRGSDHDRVRAHLDSVAALPKTAVEHALYQALLVLFPEPTEVDA